MAGGEGCGGVWRLARQAKFVIRALVAVPFIPTDSRGRDLEGSCEGGGKDADEHG